MNSTMTIRHLEDSNCTINGIILQLGPFAGDIGPYTDSDTFYVTVHFP
jgi:hypothetical protein